jgi:hypothetical protein
MVRLRDSLLTRTFGEEAFVVGDAAVCLRKEIRLVLPSAVELSDWLLDDGCGIVPLLKDRGNQVSNLDPS